MLTLDKLNSVCAGVSSGTQIFLGSSPVVGASVDLSGELPRIVIDAGTGEGLPTTQGRSRSAAEIPPGDTALPPTDLSTGVPEGAIAEGEEEDLDVETSDAEGEGEQSEYEEGEEASRESDPELDREPEPEPGTEQGHGAGTGLGTAEDQVSTDEFADLDPKK